MADKRMFSNAIIGSDVFLDMPLSAQALYLHLSMNADNEGFVGSPKNIQRMIGATDDDMQVLIDKRYILTFQSGIIVIKHWYINNNIRQDQAKKTTYIEEKSTLMLDGKQAYTEKKAVKKHTKNKQLTGNKQVTNSELTVNQLPSIVEYSIEEKSIVESSIEKNAHTRTREDNNFTSDLDCLSGIPTLQEVKDFVKLHSYKFDPEKFYNYYSAFNWKKAGQPIENWQAVATQWGREENMRTGLKEYSNFKPKTEPIQERKYTEDDMSEIFKTSEITDEEI